MAVATEVQLQDLFFAVTEAILGLDPKLIRWEYPANGQPGWEIGQNLAYMNLAPVDDPYDKQRDLMWTTGDSANATSVVKYTRVLQVVWSLYGPVSFDMADALRNSILLEDAANLMYPLEVYPIPGIAAPLKVPYLFNGQWWQRYDVTVKFNNTVHRTGTTSYFTGGYVDIEDAGGPAREITLP